jgi:hypothetical protein
MRKFCGEPRRPPSPISFDDFLDDEDPPVRRPRAEYAVA